MQLADVQQSLAQGAVEHQELLHLREKIVILEQEIDQNLKDYEAKSLQHAQNITEL